MEQQAVTCYRHPDRETGIRCTRCERSICTDCMVNAAVGFHCPECAGATRGASAAGGGPARPDVRPRTVSGAVHAADPFLVTKLLIGINVAVFLLELAVGDRLLFDYGLNANSFASPGSPRISTGVADGEWYRVITSGFLHERTNPLHIGFNMMSLWWIGAPLEQRLGRGRFLALYGLALLGGSAAVLLLAPHALTFGASGAIFGLFGATAVYMRRMRYDMRPVLGLLAINIFFSFTWANVSWQGHLGGLVAGTAVALGMLYAPRQRRELVQWGTCVAVLAVSVLLSVIAVAQITS